MNGGVFASARPASSAHAHPSFAKEIELVAIASLEIGTFRASSRVMGDPFFPSFFIGVKAKGSIKTLGFGANFG